MELSERFDQVLDDLEYAETDEQKQARKAILKAAYAATLARIAKLEAQLAAQREQIDRLLSEVAHS